MMGSSEFRASISTQKRCKRKSLSIPRFVLTSCMTPGRRDLTMGAQARVSSKTRDEPKGGGPTLPSVAAAAASLIARLSLLTSPFPGAVAGALNAAFIGRAPAPALAETGARVRPPRRLEIRGGSAVGLKGARPSPHRPRAPDIAAASTRLGVRT